MSDLQSRVVCTALATMHTQHYLTTKTQTNALGRFSVRSYGMTVQVLGVSKTTVNDIMHGVRYALDNNN
jgi:hypothetical protein